MTKNDAWKQAITAAKFLGAAFAAAVAAAFGVLVVVGVVVVNLQDALTAAIAATIGAASAAYAAVKSAEVTAKPALDQVALQTLVISQDRLREIRTDYDVTINAVMFMDTLTPELARNTFFVDDRFHPTVTVTRMRDMVDRCAEWGRHLKRSAGKYGAFTTEYGERIVCGEMLLAAATGLDELTKEVASKAHYVDARGCAHTILVTLAKGSEVTTRRQGRLLRLLGIIRTEELSISQRLPNVFSPPTLPQSPAAAEQGSSTPPLDSEGPK